MSHHFSNNNELDALRGLLGIPTGLGATGEFPRGKIHEADEGEIKIGIAFDRRTGTIILDFGKPIAVLGLSPEQASEIGGMLIDKAMNARGIQ